MSDAREEAVYMAKLQEQSERYEGLLLFLVWFVIDSRNG
jgi:hypothetical protein